MSVVMRSGSVINKNLFINNHLSQESLHNISRFMNDTMQGYDLKEILERIVPELKKHPSRPEEFNMVVDFINVALLADRNDEDGIYIDGFKNLHTSFRDDESQLGYVLSMLEEKKFIKDFFSQYISHDGVYTIIGRDGDKQMKGISIILSNYRMGEKRIGCLGIIGPQNMNYGRVLPLVRFTSNLVSEMITKISK